MNEYINRVSLINNLNTFALERYDSLVNDLIIKEPAADVVEIPKTGLGDLSDGYHTFNDLYFQRCMLFKQIVHDHKDRAWKTKFHEDGEPCFGGGWFLVAIDTPSGAYGYHYEDKYYDLFDCEELPRAKHWDGYTEKDVDRLFSLPDVVDVKEAVDEAIRILDAINSSGRMDYGDYSKLHDAICTISPIAVLI